MSTEQPIIIFTDGACSGNPGPGGWGSILVSPTGKIRELGGGESRTTNNRMEIMAAIESFKSLIGTKTLSTNKIRLYTDSTYMIKGITQWIHGWKRNGWKTAEGKEVTNKDLWLQLEEILAAKNFEVDWCYVPGHAGVAGNERCDEIAVAFSKNEQPRLYVGDHSGYKIRLTPYPKPSALPDPNRKKGKPVYLSYLDGKVHRDADWKSCEARVKGRPGAKFKKVESPEEEETILKIWGAK